MEDSLQVSYRELPPSPYLQPQWADLWRIPWGLLSAIFYFFPKEILEQIRGEEEHEHEGYEEPQEGWHLWMQIHGISLERKYFYAQDVFQDFHWHIVDGYQLRSNLGFSALSSYYFVRRSFCPFGTGLIAQAIQVEGDRNNCPIVYCDLARQQVQVLCELDEVAVLEFGSEKDDTLRFTGETEEKRFEVTISLP